MYRVEVKHAFGMFLRKTQKEIKDTFADGESKAVVPLFTGKREGS